MAIVLNTTPGTYYSANGDLIFVAYEATKATDPVTYPNYKYVCDVYVAGNFVHRMKAFPNPVNNRGIFNISQTVRAYLATIFNPTPDIIQAQQLGSGEFWLSVICKFGEEIEYTLTADLTVDSARVYFNHYNGRLNGSGYTILSNYPDKVTTNRPVISKVYRPAKTTIIPFFSHTTTDIAIQVKVYNAAGTLTSTSNGTVTPSVANNMQVLNISPYVINTVFGDPISDSSDYYTVKFNNELYTFKLNCDPKYEVNTLHFLNKYGGFDSFEFTKVSRKNETFEKKSFSQLNYKVDSSGVVSNYNANKVYNDVKTNFAVKYSEQRTLNSDLLTDAEYTWLSELVKSPMVYIEENGYYIPVNITATNYEFKKRVNDKLTNLKIDIEYGIDLNTQFR